MSERTERTQLHPALVLLAYEHGFFPMADSRTGPIGWFSPDPRAIIPLDGFRVPRSLRRVIAGGAFEIRIDTQFENVMRHCASREETWISEEIISVYCSLHRDRYAHSVEAWKEGELVGGLYGVSMGGAFFGESMFSLVPQASKAALVHLVERLRARRYLLLDTQYTTEHLAMFGTREIPRLEYLDLLARALAVDTSFRDDL